MGYSGIGKPSIGWMVQCTFDSMQDSDDKLLPHGYFVSVFDQESCGHHH